MIRLNHTLHMKLIHTEINNAHGNVQFTHNKNKPGCLFRQSQIQHFKIAKLVWKYPPGVQSQLYVSVHGWQPITLF